MADGSEDVLLFDEELEASCGDSDSELAVDSELVKLETELAELEGSSVFHDLLAAARAIGSVTLACSAVACTVAVAYALVLHPSYRTRKHFPHVPQRAVPTAAAQRAARDRWSHAVSTVAPLAFRAESLRVALDRADAGRRDRANDDKRWTATNASADALRFAHGRRAGPRGHAPLPRSWYESASFGVIANAGADVARAALDAALLDVTAPSRLELFAWRAQLPRVEGVEGAAADVLEGWVAQFDFDALAARNGSIAPAAHSAGRPVSWERPLRAVENAARTLGESFIVSWTPLHFGKSQTTEDLAHVHVLQELRPVRSGHQHFRLKSVVWGFDDDDDEPA